jgi:hypothetical protein
MRANKEVDDYTHDIDGRISCMAANGKISTGRQERWESWFWEKSNFYTRKPKRKLRHLAMMNRDEFAVLLRLRTNKGFGPSWTPSEDPAP